MALVPCRACEHSVDTSALACPRCGATDPAKKISRQQRNAIKGLIQTIFWLTVFGYGGWYAWHTLLPMARQYLVKPAPANDLPVPPPIQNGKPAGPLPPVIYPPAN